MKGKTREARLAAVWFADIVGFTGLSSRDEDAALRLRETFQTVTRKVVRERGGTVVKFLGDGGLAVFPSADAAVREGLDVRRGFESRTTAEGMTAKLRVGIHLGEVVSEPDGDVYGDGVNTALAEADTALASVPEEAFSMGFVGFVYARLGHRREALDLADELELRGDQTWYAIALVYAGLGDRERALTWLERGYAHRSPGLVYLRVDPRLDELRPDPRFVALLRRMRLG